MRLFSGLALAIIVFIIGMACSNSFNVFMMELVK